MNSKFKQASKLLESFKTPSEKFSSYLMSIYGDGIFVDGSRFMGSNSMCEIELRFPHLIAAWSPAPPLEPVYHSLSPHKPM